MQMARTNIELSLACLLFASFGASAFGREQASTDGWGRLIQIPDGAEIRVSVSGGRTLIGSFLDVTPDSLAINTTSGQETVPRHDIRKVEMKRTGKRKRNALFGLVAGTVIGLSVGLIADRASDGFIPNGGKIVFTPAGAIVGTVVGVAIPTGRWHQIYRAP